MHYRTRNSKAVHEFVFLRSELASTHKEKRHIRYLLGELSESLNQNICLFVLTTLANKKQVLLRQV